MGFSGTLGNMAKSQPSEKLSLARFESLLIKHGVIHEDAIEDYEGYDGGIMLEKVLRVFEDITGMLSAPQPITATKLKAVLDEAVKHGLDSKDRYGNPTPQPEAELLASCDNCEHGPMVVESDALDAYVLVNRAIHPCQFCMRAQPYEDHWKQAEREEGS